MTTNEQQQGRPERDTPHERRQGEEPEPSFIVLRRSPGWHLPARRDDSTSEQQSGEVA